MPRRITREEALRRLAAAPPSPCVPCDLVAGSGPRLAESAHAVAVLSRYPVRWGHALVVLRAHAERLGEVSPDAFADAARLAHRVGVALEATLRPSRCYVAALGTSEPGLPMTFPHLHLNVVPVGEPGARPREVLTWSAGVLVADEGEWSELVRALRRAL